ncbi:hypothetical protein L596_023018 [Steinernema carpocapsae]|uniref:G-protein coupled receptors family 1 profile domain-containing protein n=1 Tax=Steinernema carpocapsae TaxID=34508 RepID=A0A4U5MCD9_STECR|nr:hypothetical protein L596_023018 [Steinernema carpocapsae]
MAVDTVFVVGISYAINTAVGFVVIGFLLGVILCTKLRSNQTFRIIATLCVVDLIQLWCFAVGSYVVIMGEANMKDRPYIERFAGALIQGTWMCMAYLELALACNRLSVIANLSWFKTMEQLCLIITAVVGFYFTACLLFFKTHSHMDFRILTWKCLPDTPLQSFNFKLGLGCSVIAMALNVIVYLAIGIYIATHKLVTRWKEIRFLIAIVGGFIYTLCLACFYHYWWNLFNESRIVWVIQHHAWIFLFTFVSLLHLYFNRCVPT